MSKSVLSSLSVAALAGGAMLALELSPASAYAFRTIRAARHLRAVRQGLLSRLPRRLSRLSRHHGGYHGGYDIAVATVITAVTHIAVVTVITAAMATVPMDMAARRRRRGGHRRSGGRRSGRRTPLFDQSLRHPKSVIVLLAKRNRRRAVAGSNAIN